jgi:hypothetical protein
MPYELVELLNSHKRVEVPAYLSDGVNFTADNAVLKEFDDVDVLYLDHHLLEK